MMMHKVLHPRHDIEILYVSRTEGGRGVACIEDSEHTSKQQFKDYKKQRKSDYSNQKQYE